MNSRLGSRLIAAAIAIATLTGAWFVASDEVSGYPFVLVGQGVEARSFGDREVFTVRDGSTVVVLGRTTPGTGSPLVYCPRERFFVAPADGALFDRSGRYVDGPAEGDMFVYRSLVDAQGFLRLGKKITPSRSSGEISGEAGEAYRNWRADPDTPQRFCQDEIPDLG